MLWLFFPSIAPIDDLISSVLHRILQYPNILSELILEQNQVLGHLSPSSTSSCSIPEDCFTTEAIRKLVKLDSVCRESFRANNQYTASDRTNIGSEDMILSNGIAIPSGQNILLNGWINHRDDELQKDNLGNYDTFEPFRHIGTNHTVTKTGNDFLLFGVGRHVCP
ncbi:cytochrome P450 [Phascolomyces articulosus]|uniref:Cytochrome P450 n=1 Tax=Phascolomyces articulosus TaxID=60185 RepID=A0AAD5P8Z6_9FUNG|nr:cytochrome P450 [Phascolomyces articulosus]